MFGIWRQLRKNGVLGLNARNHRYIMRYNARSCYPLVDDKLKTKKLALAAGISVPQLYAAMTTPHELSSLGTALIPYDDFVVKPAHGSGGEGVLVINGRRKDLYVKADGSTVDLEDIRYHASNILSGIYSLGGIPDQAMFEYRVKVHPVLKPLCFRGVPDIRMLVFRGVPVMGMIRLPSRSSDGKANLHQGAVGVGICIATGVTQSGVCLNRLIEEHPDLGVPLAGLQIPEWMNLMMLSARCHELTGLDYMGVDIVLDSTYGPMILEINARPGLAIQIANQAGLQTRLDRIEALADIPENAVDRVSLALELFGTQGTASLPFFSGD